MKNIYLKLLYLIFFLILSYFCHAKSSLSDMKTSFGWVTVYYSKIDPANPWIKHPPAKRAGQAFYIGDGLYVALADIFKNAHTVEITLPHSVQPVPVKIAAINSFYNLAFIELTSKEHNPKNARPVKFYSDILDENTPVTLSWLTYKNRYISNEGRIDLIEYFWDADSRSGYTGYQVSSSQFKNHRSHFMFYKNKLAGIVFRYSKDHKTYNVIPAGRIEDFANRYRKKEINTDFSMGFLIQDLKHGDTRKFLGLNPLSDNGVLVSHVFNSGLGGSSLKVLDVITSIMHYPVNSKGEYIHPKLGAINCFSLFENMKAGVSIPLTLIRDKQEIQLDLIPEETPPFPLIPNYEFSQQLPYFHINGLVFTEISLDYLKNYGDNWLNSAPSFIAFYLNSKLIEQREQHDSRVVILLKVLPYDSNQGYADLSNLIVDHVNGEKIKNLTHLKSEIDNHLKNHTEMEISFLPEMVRSVFINPTTVKESKDIIQLKYGIQ